jgi:hypothetical protein
MITQFKIFETVHDYSGGYIFPGNFIISNVNWQNDIDWTNYIRNQIGEILNSISYGYEVKYYIDDDIYNKCFKTEKEQSQVETEIEYNPVYIYRRYIRIYIKQTEILYWSDNEEDLEFYLQGNNYNL